MKRTAVVFALLLICGCAAPALAQKADDASAKEADIRKLIEMAGAAKISDQMFEQMMGQLRMVFEQAFGANQRVNDMLKEMLARFQKSFTGERMSAAVVPIYSRYLTHDEIKGLIAFYQTPLGRKMLEVQPKIVLDSMNAGSKLGQDIMTQVMREMSKDYPELKAFLEKEEGTKPPSKD